MAECALCKSSSDRKRSSCRSAALMTALLLPWMSLKDILEPVSPLHRYVLLWTLSLVRLAGCGIYRVRQQDHPRFRLASNPTAREHLLNCIH